MDTGILLPEFPVIAAAPVIDAAYAKYSSPHGNKHAEPVYGLRHKGVTPSARMRFLHFENTFGEAHTSEYCLDAMVSLVLIMTRNTRPNAARITRLTKTIHAVHQAAGSCLPVGAATGAVAAV